MSSPSTLRTRRASRLGVVLVAVGILLGVSACTQAQMPREDYLYLNRERVGQGLPVLAWNAQLASKAQAWAQHMADTNDLSHSVLTDGAPSNWAKLGENVGTGGAVHDVHDGFMNSPTHRAAIMSTDFNQIGIGVVQVGARVWVVEEFEQA